MAKKFQESAPAEKKVNNNLLQKIFLALAIFSVQPLKMIFKIWSLNRKMKSLNSRLPLVKQQTPTGPMKKELFISYGLLAAELVVLGAIFYLLSLTGFSSLIKKITSNTISSIKYFHLIAPLFFLYLLIIISARIRWFNLFESKRSYTKRMEIALKANKINVEEGTEIWYYPGQMLYLSLEGSTGKDIITRSALWKQAGFVPTEDFEELMAKNMVTNEVILTGSPQKASNSTNFADRYEEWTREMNDQEKIWKWFLGETVYRDGFVWKESFENFSASFIGTSGSGKSEAMKTWLTAFMCKNPSTRLQIIDLKGGGDWEIYAPFTETGRIIKHVEEARLAIMYIDTIFAERKAHIAKHNYTNIREWSETENTTVPPVLLIMDEFPQLNGVLKFDFQKDKDGTPANVLFKMATTGRSFGLWFFIGTQFGAGEYVSAELNKNIQFRVILRTGSEGESMHWLDSPAAFNMRKGHKKEDGSDDGRQGYGYVDTLIDHVRFWYMHPYFIIHELIKYKVPTRKGSGLRTPKPPSVPKIIADKLKNYQGDVKKLNSYDRKIYQNLQKSLKIFGASYKIHLADYQKEERDTKLPLGYLWGKEETFDQYAARIKKISELKLKGQPLPSELITADIQEPSYSNKKEENDDSKETEELEEKLSVAMKKEEPAEIKKEESKKIKTKDEPLKAEVKKPEIKNQEKTTSDQLENDIKSIMAEFEKEEQDTKNKEKNKEKTKNEKTLPKSDKVKEKTSNILVSEKTEEEDEISFFDLFKEDEELNKSIDNFENEMAEKVRLNNEYLQAQREKASKKK